MRIFEQCSCWSKFGNLKTEVAKTYVEIIKIAGTDVMITIFCDFCQFSAKKLAFFSKTNVMIKFLNNLALFWVKNANFFAEFFSENIFKIMTSVPEIAPKSFGDLYQKKRPNGEISPNLVTV
jgi:hypothetical protein